MPTSFKENQSTGGVIHYSRGHASGEEINSAWKKYASMNTWSSPPN